MARKRPKIGDVFEIGTSQGLAYGQFLDKGQLGELVRIFEGLFDQRPATWNEVVSRPILFETYLPLQAAVKEEIFEVVANEAVDPPPPEVFKGRGFVDRDGRILDWRIIGPDGSRKVETLSAAEKKLPYRSIINDTLLVERIEAGWRNDTGL